MSCFIIWYFILHLLTLPHLPYCVEPYYTHHNFHVVTLFCNMFNIYVTYCPHFLFLFRGLELCMNIWQRILCFTPLLSGNMSLWGNKWRVPSRICSFWEFLPLLPQYERLWVDLYHRTTVAADVTSAAVRACLNLLNRNIWGPMQGLYLWMWPYRSFGEESV